MENLQTVISQQAGKIECNFEQVEKGIKERLAEYKDAVFTEDSKILAKKEIASLRSQQKEFKDNLRDAKNVYMMPWDAFEKRAKDLIALYDEPIGLIDGQVKAFEEKRIEEKRQLIDAIYQEVAVEMEEYIPLKKIYNSKWENAGTSVKAIRKEIEDVVNSTKQAIETIQSMKSEDEINALNIFKRDLSLTSAIAHINNYERQKQEIIARESKRKQEEDAERIRKEERERIAAERQAQAEKEEVVRQAEAEKMAVLQKAETEKEAAVEFAREEAVQEVVSSLSPDLNGETTTYEYRLELTEDAKSKLEMYLDSVGIDYEVEEITAWQM